MSIEDLIVFLTSYRFETSYHNLVCFTILSFLNYTINIKQENN